MKTYCFTPNTSYSGGCIIVAANSPQEAFGVISEHDDCYSLYTDIKHCKELENLVPTNITKPKVIINTLYIE